MIDNKFTRAIKRYVTEAGEPAPDATPPPDAGGEAPQPDAGADPAAGAPGGASDLGGDLGGLGGGLGGGLDMGGAPGGDQAGGQAQNNDICSSRYVGLVSYLCELYNTDMSSKKNLILNLKVKVGKMSTLNNIHNAKEVFDFMVHNLLNKDIIKEVKKNIKEAKKQIKQLKESGELKQKTKHKCTSEFWIDVATYAYFAVSSSAIGDQMPEINYGTTKDFPVDPKNAKIVFDEIKNNVDNQQNISEVES